MLQLFPLCWAAPWLQDLCPLACTLLLLLRLLLLLLQHVHSHWAAVRALQLGMAAQQSAASCLSPQLGPPQARCFHLWGT